MIRGSYSVSLTGILLAGFPIVVSRTWHVIGGFFSVAMVFATLSWLGEVERWFERALMRWDAVVLGMRVRLRILIDTDQLEL
jgi:hypothetical protein